MPKFTCQLCPTDAPFATLSGMAMRRHLQEVHHQAPMHADATFTIHRNEVAELAVLLEELLPGEPDHTYRDAAQAIVGRGWHL